jgi:hypothetical protein
MVAMNPTRASKTLRLGSLFIALGLISCEYKGEYEIAKFEQGRNWSIEILASYDVEVTQSFYYRVRVDGKVAVPIVMICAGHDTGKLRFSAITAKNGDLVGIFEQKYPNEILALHDFSSNRTWPGSFVGESNPSGYAFLEELQREHKDIQFKKGEGTGCN